jgi:hypothetical protein
LTVERIEPSIVRTDPNDALPILTNGTYLFPAQRVFIVGVMAVEGKRPGIKVYFVNALIGGNPQNAGLVGVQGKDQVTIQTGLAGRVGVVEGKCCPLSVQPVEPFAGAYLQVFLPVIGKGIYLIIADGSRIIWEVRVGGNGKRLSLISCNRGLKKSCRAEPEWRTVKPCQPSYLYSRRAFNGSIRSVE